MTGKPRPHWRPSSRLWPFAARDDIVTVVDLGAHKVACAIVCFSAPRFSADTGARNVRVIGSSVARSSGMTGGRIVNLAAMESSIRRVVGHAEGQAGLTVEGVVVTGQFHGLASDMFTARLPAGQGAPLREDMDAITSAAEDYCSAARRKLLNIFVAQATANGLDPDGGNREPSETDVTAISIPARGANQIAACFARSLLRVQAYVAGPVASTLAVTDAMQRMAGVLVIDLGAQSTGWAIFARGVPVYVDVMPQGGQAISDDIARAFVLRGFEAERLKTRFGSVLDTLQADVDLPVINPETGEPVSRFSLNHLVRSRALSMLRVVNDRLKTAGYSVPPGGVVLTGGGSLLSGVREIAAQLFDYEVRTARPLSLNGLNAGNSLSALVGACLFASRGRGAGRHHTRGEVPNAPHIASEVGGYAFRIGQWLRASF